jgi:hypothetical protein
MSIAGVIRRSREAQADRLRVAETQSSEQSSQDAIFSQPTGQQKMSMELLLIIW